LQLIATADVACNETVDNIKATLPDFGVALVGRVYPHQRLPQPIADGSMTCFGSLHFRCCQFDEFENQGIQFCRRVFQSMEEVCPLAFEVARVEVAAVQIGMKGHRACIELPEHICGGSPDKLIVIVEERNNQGIEVSVVNIPRNFMRSYMSSGSPPFGAAIEDNVPV
jgi:hypothetical protein